MEKLFETSVGVYLQKTPRPLNRNILSSGEVIFSYPLCTLMFFRDEMNIKGPFSTNFSLSYDNIEYIERLPYIFPLLVPCVQIKHTDPKLPPYLFLTDLWISKTLFKKMTESIRKNNLGIIIK